MKKQISLLAILLLGLVTTAWAASAFTVKVSIGSADVEPSLVFGQAETAVENPYPPFSSMFDVKDVYLANPANLRVTEAGEEGDLARLGTDIRALNADNQWMIVANSDAKLYFAKDVTTVNLKIFASDSTAATAEDLGDSYSVKAGVDYTIFADGSSETGKATRAVASNEIEVPLKKDGNYGLYITSEEEYKSVKVDFGTDGYMYLSVLTTDKPVYLVTGLKNGSEDWDDDDLCKNYYFHSFKTGDQVDTETAKAGWMISVLTGYSTKDVGKESITVTFVEENTLKISIGETTGEGTFSLAGVATKSGYAPITLTGLGADGNQQFKANFIIQSDGTLDFDGDGNVDCNDATFFYNYVTTGGPTRYAKIVNYADETIVEEGRTLIQDAQAALAYFISMKDNLQDLSLVEDDVINQVTDLSDSATFFYNYETANRTTRVKKITPYTTRKENTESDLEDAQEALNKIIEMDR